MNQTEISRRQKSRGTNHHLWNNNGTWWLHCTIHMSDFTKWRLRRNLRTSNVQTARQLRDRILKGNPADLADTIPLCYPMRWPGAFQSIHLDNRHGSVCRGGGEERAHE